MRKMKMKISIPLCVVLSLASASAAQTVMPRSPDPSTKEAAEKMATAGREQKVVGEVRARMAVEARITPGAPFSADAVVESTQVLADGNRINRKSVTRVFRDGEGRTRREEMDEAGTVLTVSVVDPVAHVSYVLDPSTRTAYRDSMLIAAPSMMRSRVDTAGEKMTTEIQAKKEAEVKLRQGGPPPPPPPPPLPGLRAATEMMAAGATTKENLGSQNIEGVTATGTRATTTIPVGAIGNIQPIKIVAEQWFSPDLQVLVLTKHSDPRSGETTYRLQSIVRAEPDRSLFTMPPDYVLTESGIRQPLMK
jgi:hypothetical protein